jgi:hypothetical protein
MRKPKSPGSNTPSVETPPAGGRAWARVKQFALARGLPLEVDPGSTAVAAPSKPTSKRNVKPAAGKRTKQVKTARRRST